MSLGDGLTWGDWVRLLAAERGVHGLSDRAVDQLLLEFTAWPISLDPDYIRPQLEAALDGTPLCPCCGEPITGKSRLGLCLRCYDDL